MTGINRFFSYGPDLMASFHSTAEEAKAEAENTLEFHRDRADEGWHPDVETICWGEVRQCATEISWRPRVEDDPAGLDEIVEYALKDLST